MIQRNGRYKKLNLNLNNKIPKIIALGFNYPDPSSNQALPKEPIIFTKTFSSLAQQVSEITLPNTGHTINYEIELGIVITNQGRNIKEEDALNHIGGYFLALDLTDIDLMRSLRPQGLSWDLAKGFDGACPISSFIAKDAVQDPHNLELQLKINGQMRQSSNTSEMHFKIPKIISYVSSFMTLNEGDLFITGTPAGISSLKADDQVEALLLQNRQTIASIKAKCVLEKTAKL